jgi:peptidoglycan LD-endopeptidase CwlK
MAFKLSKTSLKRLEGVHADLVRVVDVAIQITSVDFTVLEGVRTLARQRQLVASGASQTLNSRHITGHAVDLGAVVGGSVRWDWPLYYKIGEAMRVAAIECHVPINWGAAWHSNLNKFDSAEAASDAYVDLRRSQGRRPFMDGPHFELSRCLYP